MAKYVILFDLNHDTTFRRADFYIISANHLLVPAIPDTQLFETSKYYFTKQEVQQIYHTLSTYPNGRARVTYAKQHTYKMHHTIPVLQKLMDESPKVREQIWLNSPNT